MEPMLSVKGLSLSVRRTGNPVVSDLSFDVGAGEIVGIVGESGSGKTMAARAVVRLLPAAIRCDAGSIFLGGEDIASVTPKRLRDIRGSECPSSGFSGQLSF